jgi:hypothetical protein
MINVKKLRRSKFHTAITSIGTEHERQAVSTWSKSFPNVNVVGPVAPIVVDGVRYFPTQKPVSLRHALGIYLGSIPGNEICMIGEPNFTIDGEANKILEHIESERIEMTWGCFSEINGAPSIFLCTTSIVAHMMMSFNETICFGTTWQPYVHDWMQNMVRQRYFDASKYGIFSPAIPPVKVVVKGEIAKPEGKVRGITNPIKALAKK